MTELENQVSRIPELEARIAALEGEKQQQQQQQQYQQVQQQWPAGGTQTGLQDVANLWRNASGTTSQPIPPSAGIGVGYANPGYVAFPFPFFPR
jgi:hypothetical protein